ncbi:autoinducer binding domain-containing protein [Nitrosomonas sp.]|uniref:autoinducer binding domain-containing protein n=1 Tax=Nitrosomonas sp. TaxID=42353 RepID=UPI0020867D6C|nr:autoinducer binding domain-containing protein [Nitrosomonas sp.]GJL76865.1 MAG: hypothetical protein NMNS02_29710 [Nitrosomonas sp.]
MFTALKNVSLLLGFDRISYTFIPLVIGKKLNQLSPVYLISQPYENKNLVRYTSKNLKQDDLTIKRIKNGNTAPMVWRAEEKEKKIIGSDYKVCKIDKCDSSIVHGVTIPTHHSQNGVAGVSLTNSGKAKKLPLICKERLELIRAIAQVFNDRMLVSHLLSSIIL